MDVAMSAAEREAFLAEPWIGVLAVHDSRGDRAPLQTPVWYDYQPGGDVAVITGQANLKTRFIRESGRFTLCAQDPASPPRYVSVEGPVVAIDEHVDSGVREAMARRYLEPADVEKYLESTRGMAVDYIVIRMRPEHWSATDYGKLG
ncbi:Pyridoxamine 5'-phosphate oxidase [Saccharopolyspora kobensis]|uniref:Pyridoxamine 5'-phosphate oxidase n=1 Tax=Saccharopolyspora kobensis TaxID=146035 RepID=A0A1H6D3N1_9PSEU|nr:pyridoxamine 5'-phosphate oxidase family protein [Saccharopolyspora kobensis]SEG79383.1 Pyridoxamine 5'-phosphate oxidase [Saccharopolyspora kobensis]SFD08073.1 Pyridoxamine 5'-phosphate oxidase [Saccharopolyspora kobensis]